MRKAALNGKLFSFGRGRNNLLVALALSWAGLFGVLLGAPGVSAGTGINNTINFQGRLLNAAGAVVADGNYNIEFKIYQDGPGNVAGDTGGTLDWTEAYLDSNSQGVVVKNGYFSVNLGSLCTLSGGSCQGATNTGVNFNDNTLWLSMNVAGGSNATASCGATQALFTSACTPDGEMLPMKGLAASVYAEAATGLTSANGLLTAGSFIQNVAPSASQQTANFNILSGAATSVAAAEIQQVASATAPVLILKGGATPGSGADLLQLQSSSATIANIDSAGNLHVAVNGGVDTIGSGILYIGAVGSSSNATTIDVGNTGTTAQTINIGQAAITSGSETINIGTGAASGGADAITIGNATSSTSTLTFKAGAISQSLTNTGDVIATTSNSSSEFQVQNAASTNALNVDTTSYNTNLITNGSFESGTTGWAGFGPTPATIGSSVHAHEGSFGMLITTTTTGDGAKYAYQLAASTQYTFSIYAQTSAGTVSTIQLGYTNDGSTNTNCATGLTIGTGWGRINCTFTTAGSVSGTRYIYIDQSDSTGRTFYVDAAQLETAATNTPFHATTNNNSKTTIGGQLVVGNTYANTSNAALQVYAANGGGGLTVTGSGDNNVLQTAFSVTTQGGSSLLAVDDAAQETLISGGTTGLFPALGITPSNSGAIGLIINPASGQTASLLQLGSGVNAPLAKFDANGQYYSYGTNNNLLNLVVPTGISSSLQAGGSLTLSQAYYYVVTATNAQGETLASSSTTQTPVSGGTQSVKVSWSNVPGATGYKVYRNTSNSFTAGSLLLTTISLSQLTGTGNYGTAGSPSFIDTGSATAAGLPPTTTTGTGLTIQGWNGQTANLLQLENTGGSNVLSVSPTGVLTLGTPSSGTTPATGAIVFQGSGNTNTVTLQGPTSPTAGNYTLSIPAITGADTICTNGTQATACTNYAAASGDSNYIQNQTVSAQTASYWIQGTAEIAPTTTGVNALTINGTTGATAATALSLTQTGAADGEDITVSNGSSTAGSAIGITKTGAGTLTAGISFTGTIGADVYRGSGNLVVQAASGNLTLSPSTGTITVTGTTPTLTTSGATNLAVDSGGAATLNLGAGNATTIDIGSTGATVSAINIGQTTTTSGNEQVNLGTAAGSGGKDTVTIGATTGASTTTIQAGTGNINLDVNQAGHGTIVQSLANDSTSAFQIQGVNGAILVTGDTTTQNLIDNASFEGSASNPTGNLNTWTAANGAALAQNTTLANSFDGQDSLKITGSSTANNGATESTFTATPTSGNSYDLSFYAKAASGTISDITVTFNGATYTQTICNSPANALSNNTATTTWARYNCAFTAPANITSVTIGESGTTAGNIYYVDDVALIPGSNALIGGGAASIDGTLVVGAGPEAAETANAGGTALLVQGSGGSPLEDTPFVVENVVGNVLMSASAGFNTSTIQGDSTFYGTAALNVKPTSSGTGSETLFVENYNSQSIINVANNATNLVQIPTWVIESANTAPAGWAAKGTSTITYDTSNPFIGVASAKAVATAATSGLYTTNFTSTITTATQYQMTFEAKCSVPIATLTYGRQDVSGTDVNSTTTGSCSTNWQQFTAHWTTGGTITNPNIYVDSGSTTSVTIWIDAVQLVQTNTSAATVFNNGETYFGGLIGSPVTFENGGNSTSALQVANQSGADEVKVDTINNTVTAGVTPGSLSPTSVQEWDNHGTSLATLTTAPQTAGDLMIVAVSMNSAVAAHVTGITGGGVSSWNYVTSYSNPTAAVRTELWQGLISTPAASSTVTVTYSATPGVTCEIVAQEFTANIGPNTAWSITTSSTNANASSTTVTMPSLESAQSGELYWGYEWTTNHSSAGSTTGFTYHVTGNFNVIAYSNSTTAESDYAPTSTQASAGLSTGLAAVISASEGNAVDVNGAETISSQNDEWGLQVQNAAGTNILQVDTADQITSANGMIQASGLGSTSTGATGPSWVELGTCTLRAEYEACIAEINVVSGANGGGTYSAGTIYARVKQQQALGFTPAMNNGMFVNITIMGSAELLPASDVEAIPTVYDSNETVVQLWAYMANGYDNFSYNPVMNTGVWWQWTPNSGIYSAGQLPAAATNTTVVPAVYGDEADNTLLVQPSTDGTALTVENAAGTQAILSVDTASGTKAVTINPSGGTGSPGLDLNETNTSGENGVLFSLNGVNQGEIGVSDAATQIINQSASGDLNIKSLSGNINLSAGSSNEVLQVASSGQVVFTGLASAPTEVDGGMYYNSTDNSFLCGDGSTTANSNWSACSGLEYDITTTYSNTTAGVGSAVAPFTSGANTAQDPVTADSCEPGVVYLIYASGGAQDTTAQNVDIQLWEGGAAIAGNNQYDSNNVRSWTYSAQVTCISTTSVAVASLLSISNGTGSGVFDYEQPISSTGKTWSASASDLLLEAGSSNAGGTYSITLDTFVVQRLGAP